MRICEASSQGSQIGVAVRSIVSEHRVKKGGSYAMIEALIINMKNVRIKHGWDIQPLRRNSHWWRTRKTLL